MSSRPRQFNSFRTAAWLTLAFLVPAFSTPAAQSEAEKLVLQEKGETHWAFQPMTRPKPPKILNEDWPQNPIDHFIARKLEAQGLSPAPAIDRETFIRRVSFDLIGLPPTPEEIDDFITDASPHAHAALVDRLLESPRYGERWGRHWLDLARYAESDGFEHDAVRPHAWRYRDYVVQSFNADKPYDRFIREQLAGDELYPDSREALVATAFNLLGPDMVDSSDQVQRRLNRLNDMTDTAGLAFLGLTVGCARCHDHMFEPILQKDYYRLQAFFAPDKFRSDFPIPTDQEKAAHERMVREYQAKVAELEEEIKRVQEPYRQQWREAKLAELPEEVRTAHLIPSAQRTEEQRALAKESADQLRVPEKKWPTLLNSEDRTVWERLRLSLKNLAEPPALPQTMALQKGDDPPVKTHVLFRGDYASPREAVEPGAPQILGGVDLPAGGRRDLANWIAHPDNPLTARVMVNRIWQHHFGRGLVPTPSNFGLNGLPPTHPELLDWLATEFVRNGWSIKAMHRLILLSAVYRQSSHAEAPSRRVDPGNQYYSRWSPLRLEGEIIRDSMLFVSGRLNDQMGGPGVFPPIPQEVFAGASGWKTTPAEKDHQRRSIYIFSRRNLRFPFLEVFDAPDSNLSCAVRGESTTAPQSLTLLNAREVMEACGVLAVNLEHQSVRDDERVTLSFRYILGRPPTEQELEESKEFLRQSPLSELCRALFNLNAFVYVN